MEEKKIFKVIIAGGRDFNDYKLLDDKCLKILSKKLKTHKVEIVSGHAKGADELGERFAVNHNLQLYCYPADWNKYGKSAGYRRNVVMSENADSLIAFWNGESKGTKHMIDIMQRQNKPYRIIKYK